MNGTWETQTMNWVLAYWGEVITFVGLVLLLCGMAMGARYCWQLWLKDVAYWSYKTVVRNPWQWLTKPIRRQYRQWIERNLRVTMAKWKKEIIANIFYDGLSQACDEHVISKHDNRRLMSKVAEFFELADLKRKNNKIEAIRKRLAENNESKIGPKGKIPGGNPGENVVPLYFDSKYLSRKKSA